MGRYEKTLIPPITPDTTMENARKWLNIIRFGESGTVIQLQDDCEYRILEIIGNPKILKDVLGPYHRKYLLKYVPIDQKDLPASIKEALIELCLERKIGAIGILSKFTNSEILDEISHKGYEVGLFLSHITPFLKKYNFQPLYDLELLIRTSKNLSAIVFSELDITHNKYDQLVDKASFLYDHVIKYPMYSETDVRQFIFHYNYQWNFSLPEKTVNEIIEACGGYLWLIHHVQRFLRDHKESSVEQALSDELLIKKVETIWQKFTDSEKEIIRKIVFNSLQEKDTVTHEFEYLQSIKVIQEMNGKSKLGIPLLTTAIERENRLNKFQVKDNRIFIGEKEITLLLTRKERAFMLLILAAKKKIISRDTVGQAIWGKDWEEKYSDWAIDRLAHRIRKKFKTLGIDEKLLKTVKKKGFVFG